MLVEKQSQWNLKRKLLLSHEHFSRDVIDPLFNISSHILKFIFIWIFVHWISIINNYIKRLHISCRGDWKYSMNLCFGIFLKVVNFCEFWISIFKTNLTTTWLLLTSLQSVSTHFKTGTISFKMSIELTLREE